MAPVFVMTYKGRQLFRQLPFFEVYFEVLQHPFYLVQGKGPPAFKKMVEVHVVQVTGRANLSLSFPLPGKF